MNSADRRLVAEFWKLSQGKAPFSDASGAKQRTERRLTRRNRLRNVCNCSKNCQFAPMVMRSRTRHCRHVGQNGLLQTPADVTVFPLPASRAPLRES